MRKLIYILLYFFILLNSALSSALAHHSRTIFSGPCPPPAVPTPRPPVIPPPEHIQTAIGCLDTQADILVSQIVDLIIKVGGAVAFLFLLTGAFKLITSGGDPDNLTEAKHIITSSLAGLLLIVFSVVILRIVGVDVLGIPGLGPATPSESLTTP